MFRAEQATVQAFAEHSEGSGPLTQASSPRDRLAADARGFSGFFGVHAHPGQKRLGRRRDSLTAPSPNRSLARPMGPGLSGASPPRGSSSAAPQGSTGHLYLPKRCIWLARDFLRLALGGGQRYCGRTVAPPASKGKSRNTRRLTLRSRAMTTTTSISRQAGRTVRIIDRVSQEGERLSPRVLDPKTYDGTGVLEFAQTLGGGEALEREAATTYLDLLSQVTGNSAGQTWLRKNLKELGLGRGGDLLKILGSLSLCMAGGGAWSEAREPRRPRRTSEGTRGPRSYASSVTQAWRRATLGSTRRRLRRCGRSARVAGIGGPKSSPR